MDLRLMAGVSCWLSISSTVISYHDEGRGSSFFLPLICIELFSSLVFLQERRCLLGGCLECRAEVPPSLPPVLLLLLLFSITLYSRDLVGPWGSGVWWELCSTRSITEPEPAAPCCLSLRSSVYLSTIDERISWLPSGDRSCEAERRGRTGVCLWLTQQEEDEERWT